MKLSMRSIKKNPIVAIGLMAFAVTPAHAVNYSFSDMGGLSDLANPIHAYGINNLGQVVGGQRYSAGGSSAVQWNGSTWTPLANLAGSSDSDAWDINDSGQVVGYSTPTGVDAAIPVRWDNGVPTQLDSLVPGVNYDFPATINNSGQVYGMYWDGAAVRPAIWAAGGTALTVLPTLGGSSGYVWYDAINEAGQMVAPTNTTGDDAVHATAYINSAIYDLGTLGGLNSEAAGINNSGQIVGVANNADETQRPVIWNDYLSAPIELGTLGGAAGMALVINDNGLIAGWSDTADGESHITLWDHGQIIDMTQFIPTELITAGWHSQQEGNNNSGLSADWLGINNAGTIVTNLYDNADHAIPIMLTPTAVPVPGALWLFGSALTGFMSAAKRKKLAY
jgi:probable HAF family extracellular repeat protein